MIVSVRGRPGAGPSFPCRLGLDIAFVHPASKFRGGLRNSSDFGDQLVSLHSPLVASSSSLSHVLTSLSRLELIGVGCIGRVRDCASRRPTLCQSVYLLIHYAFYERFKLPDGAQWCCGRTN